MTTRTRIALALALAAAVLSVPATAQQPGTQGPGGPGFGAAQRRSYKIQLMRMVRHIGEIDKNKKFALTPAQAKQVLAVLKPLRSKPKLTDDQAKAALKALKAIFTVDQLNAMAAIKPPRFGGAGGAGGRMGPGGPGGPGGSPGGPPGGAGQRRFDPNAMRDWNPFNAKAKSDIPGAAQMKKRQDAFFAGLEARAKSAAKPVKVKPAGRRK